ncbi:5'-3'-deoxyribonucleotidase [Candidatus Woesearchaeota archaeon]|nr:5'-3'-deoxyribonucleotidase [Candidatus Woesearchaeota archaeon]
MKHNMPKGTYLVDMDGVLADYVGKYNEKWLLKFPQRPFVSREAMTSHQIEEHYDKKYIEDIKAISQDKKFFAELEELPGAVEGIERLLHQGNDVYICTSPNILNDYCEHGKKQWVKEHLGMFWVRRMIITKDKTLVRGDYLIDDKPRVSGIMQPTWKQILYDQPYNRQEELQNNKRMTWHKGLFTLQGF